jgi:hypothetical protein
MRYYYTLDVKSREVTAHDRKSGRDRHVRMSNDLPITRAQDKICTEWCKNHLGNTVKHVPVFGTNYQEWVILDTKETL